MAGWCVCVSVCLCECVCACVWVNGGKGKGHGKAKRETRGGAGVQYSIYKLALSEESERGVLKVCTLHMCVFVWLCKNMIQLLIDAFVSVPMPMSLSLFVNSHVQSL